MGVNQEKKGGEARKKSIFSEECADGRARQIKLKGGRLKLDTDRDYGLVLEGGGARGAFQIGAWRALKEAGIRIKGVAGVSVGALNGALICMDELEKAIDIWDTISYSKVMDVDDNLPERLAELKEKIAGLKLSELTPAQLRQAKVGQTLHEVLEEIKKFLKDKGFDITPLKNLIHDTVDEEKIRSSACELFATTYSLSDRRLLNQDVKLMPRGEIEDILLASAYLPVFKSEKLGGKLYADGGGFNNVPLDVLVDKGYKDIIVIRIYGLGFDREKKIKVLPDTRVYHIAPREELGGLLEFDKKRSRKNMALGYLEAGRLLYGLAGRRYYIFAPQEEPYYFSKMMSEMELLKLYLGQELEPDRLRPLGKYRFYIETVFPEIAKRLKLSEDWDYKDMYLAVLEELAARFQVFRYRVYTDGELVREIHKAF